MKLTLRHLAPGLLVLCGHAHALEEVLTPARYVECQIAAQQATLVGLEERAAERSDLSDADKRQRGEQARHRVTLAIYSCGKQTPATLGAYAYRHADELQAWLAANPQANARLQALGKRIGELSAQMPPVAPSAKR